jgi:hypothetical protein
MIMRLYQYMGISVSIYYYENDKLSLVAYKYSFNEYQMNSRIRRSYPFLPI